MVQCICTPAAIFSTNLIGLQPIGIVYIGIGIVHSIVIMHAAIFSKYTYNLTQPESLAAGMRRPLRATLRAKLE